MNYTAESHADLRHQQPIDIALSAARSYQSGQTGYIHYCYKNYDDELHETIPIQENLLFGLALLRTKMADSILEAKVLINRLLYFQNQEQSEQQGNFPVYLHDFPQCRDVYYGVHLLAPCYWILSDHRKSLGQELSTRMQAATEKLFAYCLQLTNSKETSYLMRLKMAAAIKAFGKLWNRADLISDGETKLNALQAEGLTSSWLIPSQIADMLIALQMAYEELATSPWASFWQHLSSTWHREAHTYVGPGLQERQKQFEPQCTLYDLFLGHFSGTYSYRALDPHPYQLQAALISLTREQLPTLTYPFECKGRLGEREWTVYQTGDYGYATLQQVEQENPSLEYRVHPFRLAWGSRTRTHSLVLQGGNAGTIDVTRTADGVVEIGSNLVALQGERDNARDVAFYIDKHESLTKSINGSMASTFQLGDLIQLKSDEIQIDIQFSSNSGLKFFGHLMPGNRPAQMGLKGANRFLAFDDQIFLRGVDRKRAARVVTRLSIS